MTSGGSWHRDLWRALTLKGWRERRAERRAERAKDEAEWKVAHEHLSGVRWVRCDDCSWVLDLEETGCVPEVRNGRVFRVRCVSCADALEAD